MKKSSERRKHCARGQPSISVPNLKRIALFVEKLLGVKNSKLGHVAQATPTWGRFIFLRREAPSSMSIPNLKLIAEWDPLIIFERTEL